MWGENQHVMWKTDCLLVGQNSDSNPGETRVHKIQMRSVVSHRNYHDTQNCNHDACLFMHSPATHPR